MMKREKDHAFYNKLWSLMIPIVLQNLMLALVAVADAFMLGGMDQNYMSAVSLATQIQFIQNMFLSAATASLGILGAQYWGKGDIKTLDALFCMALLMVISAPIILHFVKLTPQAAGYLKGMFAVIAVYMIGRAVNDVTINGIFGAGGDTMFDMYSLAVCMWCLAIPLAVAGTYFLHWSVVLVYACTCIDEVGKLPWVLYHFRKYKWVKDLTH